jgi:hypothetical protein
MSPTTQQQAWCITSCTSSRLPSRWRSSPAPTARSSFCAPKRASWSSGVRCSPRTNLRSTARAAATHALHRQVLTGIHESGNSARSSFRVIAALPSQCAPAAPGGVSLPRMKRAARTLPPSCLSRRATFSCCRRRWPIERRMPAQSAWIRFDSPPSAAAKPASTASWFRRRRGHRAQGAGLSVAPRPLAHCAPSGIGSNNRRVGKPMRRASRSRSTGLNRRLARTGSSC